MADTISSLFKSLYVEFIELLHMKGLADKAFTMEPGNRPSLDFKTISGHLLKEFDTLKNLPSYAPLTIMVAEQGGVDRQRVENVAYGLFFNLFTELTLYLAPPVPSIAVQQQNTLDSLELSDAQVSRAILQSTDAIPEIVMNNKFVVIFENLETESDIIISDDIKLVQLSEDDIKKRYLQRFDSRNYWERVHSAFEINRALLDDMDFLPILGTLLRLFKPGDVRFKSVLQETNHFIRGPIFVGPKHKPSESDYHEHAPNRSSSGWKPYESGWRSYKICKSEAEEFAKFIAPRIKKMRSMAQSCRVYNMIPSASVQLKIPLLFFVLESFFSDIKSEVGFRLALYVTNLLSEDKDFMAKLKNLYAIRSCIAHGDLKEAQNKIRKLNYSGELHASEFRIATEQLDSIVQRLWFLLIEIDWEPSKSSQEIVRYLITSK